MNSLRRTALWSVFVLFFPAAASATIDYRVSVAQPAQHVFHVSVSVPDAAGELAVELPAWNALYQVRDFAYHVQDVRAHGPAGPLAVRKLDKQTWQISTGAGKKSVVITYGAEWDEPGPFSTQLNAEHAFINLATILMYVPSRRGEDTRVTFTDLPSGWKSGIQLAPAGDAQAFSAKSYDTLVDAPVELGTFDEFRFTAEGSAGSARIRVIVHASHPLDEPERQKLREMLTRIVATETSLMREVPFDEYLFLYHFDEGGGGMEHMNCTAIHAGSAETAAGVTAHEFFHLWNVKRIRPRSLEPVDYRRENWTRALWFAEGVTSTYGSFTLVRSGLWSKRQFLEDLGYQIAQLDSRPARRWKSVEEASLDAWFEKYRDYHESTLSISYYNKGQILGVLLDILIRDATRNRTSLDDVLRQMNDDFAHKGRFYDDSADIRATAEKIAGRSFEEFFARYVAGTDELPYADILGRAGLLLKKRENGRGYSIEEIPESTPLQQRIREGLLRGTTEPLP